MVGFLPGGNDTAVHAPTATHPHPGRLPSQQYVRPNPKRNVGFSVSNGDVGPAREDGIHGGVNVEGQPALRLGVTEQHLDDGLVARAVVHDQRGDELRQLRDNGGPVEVDVADRRHGLGNRADAVELLAREGQRAGVQEALDLVPVAALLPRRDEPQDRDVRLFGTADDAGAADQRVGAHVLEVDPDHVVPFGDLARRRHHEDVHVG
jgi:hypothetical protein